MARSFRTRGKGSVEGSPRTARGRSGGLLETARGSDLRRGRLGSRLRPVGHLHPVVPRLPGPTRVGPDGEETLGVALGPVPRPERLADYAAGLHGRDDQLEHGATLGVPLSVTTRCSSWYASLLSVPSVYRVGRDVRR